MVRLISKYGWEKLNHIYKSQFHYGSIDIQISYSLLRKNMESQFHYGSIDILMRKIFLKKSS